MAGNGVMDWSNETYVRLYTRDTTTWKRLGWNGQCVFMALLRKVDRAGVLDLSGLEPWEGIMLHVECPEDVARDAVAKMLRAGVVTFRDGSVTIPNFLAAQEARKSDRQRAKESREARSLGIRPRSQNVTNASGNEAPESQNQTPASQPVTSGHRPSQPVTLTSADPDPTLPSADPTLASSPRSQGESAERGGAFAGQAASGAHNQTVREGWAAAYEEAGLGAPPVLGGQPFTSAVEFARSVARTHGKSLYDAARDIAAAVIRDPKADRVWGLSRVDPYARKRPVDTSLALPEDV